MRGGEDLIAVGGEQRLVGGDNVLAVGDGLEHEFLGYPIAADQLDDDVDVRIGHDLIGVPGDRDFAAGEFLRPLGVLVGHLRDDDAATGASRDFFLVAAQHFPDAAADRADAQQAYIDWFHIAHCRTHLSDFLKLNEVMTMPSRK